MRSFNSSAFTLQASGGRAVTAHSMGQADSPAVMHTTTPNAAQAFADSGGAMLPSGARQYIARVGPELGLHVRPGAIGVALLQSQAHS